MKIEFLIKIVKLRKGQKNTVILIVESVDNVNKNKEKGIFKKSKTLVVTIVKF
jgi:hypothetical protein